MIDVFDYKFIEEHRDYFDFILVETGYDILYAIGAYMPIIILGLLI